jgi:hypothetical protein
MRKRAKLLLKKQNNDEKPTLASSFKQSIQQKGKRKNKKRETQVLVTRAKPKMEWGLQKKLSPVPS